MNDFKTKIADAVYKEKLEAWEEMPEEQKLKVYEFQACVNRLMLSFVEGNAKCVCGGRAYRAAKVGAGTVAVTSCYECTTYTMDPVERVRCCCARRLEVGEIHQCPHERQPIVAQMCVPCRSKR